MLLPGLRPLWRDPYHVQLGTDPAAAVVLEFPVPAAAAVLDLLDGGRTRAELDRDARHRGVPPATTAAVLATLHAAGVLRDATELVPAELPEPARYRLAAEVAALARRPRPGYPPAEILYRRARAHVTVSGQARLAAPIAAALAAAGVGHVHAALAGVARRDDHTPGGLLPGDAGRPRDTAAAEAVARAAPGTGHRPARDRRPALVVHAGAGTPPGLAALGMSRRKVAYLGVALRDAVAVLGPLVPPGGTPCLYCLELHRRDRDPAWPVLAAQLATGGEATVPGAVTTVLAAAAATAAEALDYLDGYPTRTVGATVEITAPGRERRRSWPPHPRCDCTRRREPGDHPPG